MKATFLFQMKFHQPLNYHKHALTKFQYNMAKSFITPTISESTSHLTTQLHNTTTTQQNLDFTNNSFLDQGYVEWYWVALGLIVPVLLGTLFCVLDHMRRKKRVNSKHNEERLESMCERNKYTPPSYDEIIPNNQVVIEPVPEFTIPPPELHANHIPVFTIESEHVQQAAAAPSSTNQASAALPRLTVNAHTDNSNQTDSSTSVNSSTQLTMHSPAISQAPSTVYTADDDSSVFEDVDLTDGTVEAPPSYEDYHKYELFGSRAELV